MVDFLIKLLIFTYLLFASASAVSLKNIEVSGNKRISDETIKMFSEIDDNSKIDNNIIINKASLNIVSKEPNK